MLIVLGGLLLRLQGLTHAAVWYDEAFGLLAARLPLSDLLNPLSTNRQAPLWFWVLSLWGTQPLVWARLLGVLTGVVTILALWPLHRQLGWRITLLAMGLLAVHPVHVHQSQEIRMYALVVLFIAVALNLALAQARGGSRWGWVLLALSAWAALLTQWLAGAVLAGMWVGMLLARRGKIDRVWLIGWLLSGLVAVLGVLPWLLRVARDSVFATQEPLPFASEVLRQLIEGFEGHLRRAPWEWFGGSAGLGWSIALALLMLGLTGLGAAQLARSDRRPEAMVIGGAFFVGLLLLIAYQAMGLVFFTRYLIILLVPALILVAASLVGGGQWPWSRALLGVIVAGGLLSHSIAVGKSNGQVREVTGRFLQMVEYRAEQGEIPPMLCTARFLGFSLRASLPENDIRLLDSPALTESERFVLGPGAVAQEWPEEWSGPVWVVISGWGPPLWDQNELAQRAQEAVLQLGGNLSVGRISPPLSIQGGVKWAHVVEME